MPALAFSLLLLLQPPPALAQDDDCGVGDAKVVDDIELILESTAADEVSPLPHGELLRAGDWIQVEGWTSAGPISLEVATNSGAPSPNTPTTTDYTATSSPPPTASPPPTKIRGCCGARRRRTPFRGA